MQKSEAIQNHKIEGRRVNLYHVLFTRILKDGERTRDEYSIITYTKREFREFKKYVDKWGLKAIQFYSYEVIHDPTQVEAEKVEPSELEEIKKYLIENGVEFHPRTGIVKLRKLKEETELKTE